jgi:imidazolonepropionase-like amidohydrolase
MVTAWHLRGVVLPDETERDLWVADGRIRFQPVDGAATLCKEAFLLPGLVDVHAHLALASPAGDEAAPADRVRASALAHLAAGVLALREPGGPDYSSAGLGPRDGLPRVTTAGRFLAPPGRYFPGLAREVSDDQLPDAALEELAVSGQWVKLIGDSPLPGPEITPTFGVAALAETVRRVHQASGRVAIHCTLPEVIQAALDNYADSLEHASFLQPDQIPALAASGAAWVPTCLINDAIRQMIPAEAAARLDRQAEVICAAADAGVPVLAGTDAGLGPHGQVREEVRLLHRAGLPAADAVGAASWVARRWLGWPGIEDGAPADLVAYRTDPRQRVDALAEPVAVLLDGQPVRC